MIAAHLARIDALISIRICRVACLRLQMNKCQESTKDSTVNTPNLAHLRKINCQLTTKLLGLEKSIQALKVQISNYPPAEMISLFRLVEFLGFDAAEDKNLGRETCDF